MNLNNDFFQLIRYFEKYYLEENLFNSNPSNRKIQCHASAELTFPHQTIQSIHQDEQGIIHLFVNYLGLYGVDSPLPHYWISLTHNDSEQAKKARAFLDIFQQRIYDLFYLAWKKYQVLLQLEQQDSHYLNYLHALSGGVINDDNLQEYACVSLFGQRVHNALSLTNILNHCCKGIPVTIKQFVPHWDCIDKNNCITHQHQNGLLLNNNTLLGQRVMTVTLRILIELGPISLQKAFLLLRDPHHSKVIVNLIKRYINILYEFAIFLLVQVEKCQRLILGQDQFYLGWGSFIGNTHNQLCKIKLY